MASRWPGARATRCRIVSMCPAIRLVSPARSSRAWRTVSRSACCICTTRRAARSMLPSKRRRSATTTGRIVYFVETMRVVRQASSRAAAQGLVGRSPAFVGMLEKILRVANSDAAVLLLGETGTGKELVARAIHEASARGGGAVRGGGLRRHDRNPVRERTVRLRKRSLHRRHEPQAGPGRGRFRRHAVSRRNRRTAAGACRSSCCACWRPAPIAGSAGWTGCRPISAWSRPPTATCAPWCRPKPSAATCISASIPFRFTRRRCTSEPATFPLLAESLLERVDRKSRPALYRRPRWNGWAAGATPAISANCAT